jgi:hypothetical protein
MISYRLCNVSAWYAVDHHYCALSQWQCLHRQRDMLPLKALLSSRHKTSQFVPEEPLHPAFAIGSRWTLQDVRYCIPQSLVVAMDSWTTVILLVCGQLLLSRSKPLRVQILQYNMPCLQVSRLRLTLVAISPTLCVYMPWAISYIMVRVASPAHSGIDAAQMTVFKEEHMPLSALLTCYLHPNCTHMLSWLSVSI